MPRRPDDIKSYSETRREIAAAKPPSSASPASWLTPYGQVVSVINPALGQAIQNIPRTVEAAKKAFSYYRTVGQNIPITGAIPALPRFTTTGFEQPWGGGGATPSGPDSSWGGGSEPDPTGPSYPVPPYVPPVSSPPPSQRFQPPAGTTPPTTPPTTPTTPTTPTWPTTPAPTPVIGEPVTTVPPETPTAEAPSWWGADIFGEGWVYLPTAPGEVPTQWQGEGTKPVGPGWYYLPNVQYFNQLPPQWRDWLIDVVQKEQANWPDPAISPVQWMPSAQPEQRAPLYMWEPLAGGTPGGQHAIQPPGAPYAPPPPQPSPPPPDVRIWPQPDYPVETQPQPIYQPQEPTTLPYSPAPGVVVWGKPPNPTARIQPIEEQPTYQWPNNMQPDKVYAL